MTPLKGADGQVYAMAQGNLLVGGFGAAASGSQVQVNHLSAGRITGGATVERAVPVALGEGDVVRLDLHTTDFSIRAGWSKRSTASLGRHRCRAGWAGSPGTYAQQQRPKGWVPGGDGESQHQPCAWPGQSCRQQPHRVGGHESGGTVGTMRNRSRQSSCSNQHRTGDQPAGAIFQRTNSASAAFDY